MKPWRLLQRFATLFLAWPAFLMISGCAPVMSFGSMPRIDQLPTLKGGVSSAQEVVVALGEPRGQGQARFAAELPEQQIWFYEYTQANGSKVQMKILLVFMEKDVYVGHLWFSSGLLLGATK